MLLHVGVSSRRCAILVQFVLGVRKQKAARSSAIPTKVSVSWEQQSGSKGTTTKNDENQTTNRNARSNTTAIELIAPPNLFSHFPFPCSLYRFRCAAASTKTNTGQKTGASAPVQCLLDNNEIPRHFFVFLSFIVGSSYVHPSPGQVNLPRDRYTLDIQPAFPWFRTISLCFFFISPSSSDVVLGLPTLSASIFLAAPLPLLLPQSPPSRLIQPGVRTDVPTYKIQSKHKEAISCTNERKKMQIYWKRSRAEANAMEKTVEADYGDHPHEHSPRHQQTAVLNMLLASRQSHLPYSGPSRS